MSGFAIRRNNMLFKIYCFFCKLLKVKLELEKPEIKQFKVFVIEHGLNGIKEYPFLRINEQDTISLFNEGEKKYPFLKIDISDKELLINTYSDKYIEKLKEEKK